MAPSFRSHKKSPYYGQALKEGEIRLLTITRLLKVTPFHDNRPESPSRLGPLFQQSLRLLRRERDELVLTTRVCKIADDLEFKALSYVWGTAEASIPVKCNGRTLLVTPSAYDLLYDLHLSNYRYSEFWIDAICIDQKNTEEKATQIPLMHNIFVRAEQVIVWMGQATDLSRPFMKDFQEVSDLAKTWKPRKRSRAADWRGNDWPKDLDPFWNGFFEMLNNEWFRRLWTFQEIVLSKQATILCGLDQIDADDFVQFVSNGYYRSEGYVGFHSSITSMVPGKPTKSELAFKICDAIAFERGQRKKHTSGINAVQLPLLLDDLRSRRVSKPVDRVWAIVALLDARIQQKMVPFIDYSDKGCEEYWKTHVRFAKAVLCVTNSLSLLFIPRPPQPIPQQLPSWCPSLTGHASYSLRISGHWNRPIEKRTAAAAILYNAGNDRETSEKRKAAILGHPSKFISTVETDDLLWIRGFVVDTITDVVDSPPCNWHEKAVHVSNRGSHSNQPHYDLAARGFFLLGLDLARKTLGNPNDDSVPHEFIMSLFCDHRIVADAETSFHDVFTMEDVGSSRHYDSLRGEQYKRASAFDGRFRSMIGHSFFATEQGRFGIASPGMRRGDKVCVFYGGEPLYILRWKAGAEEVIRGAKHADEPAEFCGVAYVPNLMEPHQSDAARLGPDEIFGIA